MGSPRINIKTAPAAQTISVKQAIRVTVVVCQECHYIDLCALPSHVANIRELMAPTAIKLATHRAGAHTGEKGRFGREMFSGRPKIKPTALIDIAISSLEVPVTA